MPEDTVLRKTVRSQTMMTALLGLANNAYQLLGSDAISVTADEQKTETMQIRVTDGVPDSVNLALTLFWQYAARRFLGVDTEEVEEEYFTETLARIYIKQGHYEKALGIIGRLSERYPKKNAYFADQIRFLEKLIINSNTKLKK